MAFVIENDNLWKKNNNLITTQGYSDSTWNPYGLPSKTIRLKFKSDVTEQNITRLSADSYSLVSEADNVWELTYDKSNWEGLFRLPYNAGTPKDQVVSAITEIVAANLEGVTDINNCFWNSRLTATCPIYAPDAVKLASFFELSDLRSCPSVYVPNADDAQQFFYNCSNLKSFNGFVDSHNVNNLWRTFCNCGSLTSIGWFDTYNVVNMSETFSGCIKLTKVPQYNTAKLRSKILALTERTCRAK